MKCKNCNYEVSKESKFCNHCGANIEAEGILCPNKACGKTCIPIEALFCPECGSSLSNEENQSKKQQSHQPQKPKTSSPTKEKRIKNSKPKYELETKQNKISLEKPKEVSTHSGEKSSMPMILWVSYILPLIISFYITELKNFYLTMFLVAIIWIIQAIIYFWIRGEL